MKKKLIIIATAVVLVLAIVLISVFAPKVKVDRNLIKENKLTPTATAEYLEDESLELLEEGYSLVGKSGDLELYYNQADYTIKVKNVTNGYEYKSFIGDDEYIHNADQGNTENSEDDRKTFSRLFEISYTNFVDINSSTSINTDPYVSVELYKLKNGLAVETSFDTGISVTIEMWLDETGLNVRVPLEKIKEDGALGYDDNGDEIRTEYGLTSLTLLPMFGSMNDQAQNSFLLFPDSNGGIYNVKPISGRQNPITSDIYFSRDFDLDDIEKNNSQGIKNALMPFFGGVNNQNGFVGYITEGEMNSCITLNPSGTLYNINRIEPVVIYRKSFSYLDPSGNTLTETEKDISATDFAVHYSFVSGKDNKSVTYSDLAASLRSFLSGSGRLVKTESVKDERVNVNLQMMMSTKSESMIGEFLKAMTKCEDIENLIGGLSDEAGKNLRVMLLGWQTSGYNVYPSSAKLTGKIGNVEKLSRFLTENGIDSYLVDDQVSALLESSNFSKQSDAVYNGARIPVTNTDGDQYILNPYREYLNLTKKRLPYYEKKSVCGVGFDKIGWYVFDDAMEDVALKRYETAAVYRAMLKSTKDAGFKTAVQRGNAYTLFATDYLYDIPRDGSSYELIDREIPFYQLVVHGYIPYSLDIPGNMSIDYNLEKLKWIEYGAEPTFLLTEEMSEEFKDSKVGNAFSTEISTWKDEVEELCIEFNSKLAFTGNNTMSEHTLVANNVYRVGYSNGYKVYVNYNSNAVTVDGHSVPAENYIVVDASGAAV